MAPAFQGKSPADWRVAARWANKGYGGRWTEADAAAVAMPPLFEPVVQPERRRVNNGAGQMMAIDAIVECFGFDPEEDAELVCRLRRVCSSSGSGDDSD